MIILCVAIVCITVLIAQQALFIDREKRAKQTNNESLERQLLQRIKEIEDYKPKIELCLLKAGLINPNNQTHNQVNVNGFTGFRQ